MHKVKMLSRTYATAVAGELKVTTFVPETAHFQLQYAPNATVAAPTEIFLNQQLYYPRGFSVTITPNGAATWQQPEKNYIQLKLLQPQTPKITVDIWANK
jgi:endoglycosylceramidase